MSTLQSCHTEDHTCVCSKIETVDHKCMWITVAHMSSVMMPLHRSLQRIRVPNEAVSVSLSSLASDPQSHKKKNFSISHHPQQAEDLSHRSVAEPATSRGPSLTDAVVVREAFPRHTVAPQALVHVIAGLPILHPVISCCGNDQEDVPHACTKQPSAHEAVHPAPAHTHTHRGT